MKSLRDFVRLPAAGIQFGLMASYHCTVKAGASATAAAHADYIEREGKYKSRAGSDLEAVESGNLPDWAKRSADLWQASDAHERVNAKAYREYEVALPREMTPAQRLELVRAFVRQELGERHAYTFAIHNPRAALEGGEQPHAHIMFSERLNDGIKRDTPEHYFKQASSKDPGRGGCKKVNSARKTSEERKADLIALRARWADLQNEHLAKHGHADRVDHRTLAERGVDRFPAEHLGPKAAAMEKRGHPTWRGQARAQRLVDTAELDAIPELTRSLQAARAALDELLKSEAAKPVPADQPHQADPIQERIEQEAKDTQVVASWRRLVQAERTQHLQELTATAFQAAKAHASQLQTHLAAQPKIFGRKEWEVKRIAMEDRDHRLRLDHNNLKTGRFPFLQKDKEAVQQEALRRASAKDPKLAAAQASAEIGLRAKAQREQAQRMEKARADYQVEQARKAEKGRGKGYSR